MYPKARTAPRPITRERRAATKVIVSADTKSNIDMGCETDVLAAIEFEY